MYLTWRVARSAWPGETFGNMMPMDGSLIDSGPSCTMKLGDIAVEGTCPHIVYRVSGCCKIEDAVIMGHVKRCRMRSNDRKCITIYM